MIVDQGSFKRLDSSGNTLESFDISPTLYFGMLIFSLLTMHWHLPNTIQYSVVFRLFQGVKMAIQAKILNVGIDTLKLNVKYPTGAQILPVELEVYCSQWQQQAREKSKPVATTITF